MGHVIEAVGKSGQVTAICAYNRFRGATGIEDDPWRRLISSGVFGQYHPKNTNRSTIYKNNIVNITTYNATKFQCYLVSSLLIRVTDTSFWPLRGLTSDSLATTLTAVSSATSPVSLRDQGHLLS
jgi:hypothetical protein